MQELGLALVKVADLEFKINVKEEELALLKVERNTVKAGIRDFYNLVNQYIEDTKK